MRAGNKQGEIMKTILTRAMLINFYYSTYTIDEKINLKAKLMQ